MTPSLLFKRTILFLGILAIVIILFVNAKAIKDGLSKEKEKTESHNQRRNSSSVDFRMKEVLDSVEGKLILRSTIVAKFPDKEKHCLYYLQDNHLYIFNAKDKSNKEINLTELNAKAIVDFEGNGVQSADPSANHNYIIIIAARNAANTEYGLYRMGTDPDNLILDYIDKGEVTKEKDRRYSVQSNGRKTIYDDNGNKISGISEGMPTQETKPKKDELPSRGDFPEEIRNSETIIDTDPPSEPKKPEMP